LSAVVFANLANIAGMKVAHADLEFLFEPEPLASVVVPLYD
jgi:hypothetical protein